MMSLTRPMQALARCSVYDEQPPHDTVQAAPYISEVDELRQRMRELEIRTRYIEERLGIVRREVEGSDHGVEV